MKKLLCVVALLVAVSTVSFGQLGLYSIGGGVGIVSVSNSVGTGFVIGAGADLGEITTNLRLRPDIGFWSVSKSEFGVDLSFSDFSLNANVVYPITSGGKITPFYVGGGLGFNFVSSEVVIPGFGTGSASDTKLGINLLGGAGTPIGEKLNLVGEVRYVIVSDFGHFGAVVGISYQLRQ